MGLLDKAKGKIDSVSAKVGLKKEEEKEEEEKEEEAQPQEVVPPAESSTDPAEPPSSTEPADPATDPVEPVVESVTTTSEPSPQGAPRGAPEEDEKKEGRGVFGALKEKASAVAGRISPAPKEEEDVRAPSSSPSSGLKAKMESIANEGKTLVADKVEDLKEKIDDADLHALATQGAAKAAAAKDRIMGEVREIMEDSDGWVEKKKEEMRAWKEEKEREMSLFFATLKERVHLWILERVEEMIDKGLDRLLPKFRAHMKDPYMPMVIQRQVDRVIDGIWTDLKEEVIEIVVGAFRPVIPPYFPPDNGGCCACWRSFRNGVRYHLFPFDKSIWQQMRDPWFVAFQFICLIPVPGLLQFMWFWVLACIDREDEYQLLFYIWSFKKLQFVTLGCIKVIIGTGSYYRCVVEVPSNCKERWTIATYDSFGIVFLIVQIFVVWGVFSLLPRSQQKGSYHKLLKESHERRGIQMEEGVYVAAAVRDRTDSKVERDLADKERREQRPFCGHLMMRWLIYDMVIFFCCLAFGLWAMFGHTNSSARVNSHDRDGGVVSNWRFTATLYWLQALYGIMSFPFLLFALPLAHTLFTHAKPTGYNPDGHCVPFIGLSVEEKEKRKKFLMDKANADNIEAGEEDTEDMVKEERKKQKLD